MKLNTDQPAREFKHATITSLPKCLNIMKIFHEMLRLCNPFIVKVSVL